jgi:hypothetical protein
MDWAWRRARRSGASTSFDRPIYLCMFCRGRTRKTRDTTMFGFPTQPNKIIRVHPRLNPYWFVAATRNATLPWDRRATRALLE